MRRTVARFGNLLCDVRSRMELQRLPSLVSLRTGRTFAATGTTRSVSLPKEACSTGTLQQVRKYAPTATTTVECWNCSKRSQNRMICPACGYLQDVDMDVDYFDLLEIPKTFDVEQLELTRRFRQLQTLVHPDKYSNKSSREQNNSSDWSSLINKAYKTLSVPIDRGQYILKLHGQRIPEDNSALNKEFLLEMMERNEEVEEANDSESLQRLNMKIVNEINEKVGKLNAQFDKSNLDEAKSTLVEMKYLLSIQNSIKNKLQKLMGS